MTDIEVVKLLREALMIILVIGTPLLGIGMLVGLLVSIFQTTTSIQEQTLTFIPKIIAMFLTLMIFATWIIHTMVNYTKNLFMLIEKIGMG